MCSPSEHTPDYLKEQVSLALKGETPVEEMRILFPTGEELSSLTELKNEEELHLVFQLSDEEWEPVDLADMDVGE